MNSNRDYLKDVEGCLISLARHVPEANAFDCINYLFGISDIMFSYDDFLKADSEEERKQICGAIEKMTKDAMR